MAVSLPIDPLLPELVETVRRHRRLVLEAPPGAGKTTRVPPALRDAVEGAIWVLEPRRLAARLAARRVAEEVGATLGHEVGYQVRYEKKARADTRVLFMTEGLFVRRLMSNPTLEGVGAVVVDEVHERHLHTDTAIALTRRLMDDRPDLALVLMSATVEADAMAEALEAPVVRSEGRAFPVALEHLERPDERYLDAQVRGAVQRLLKGGLEGDVLVFLPGAGEIRRSLEALEPVARSADLEVLPLHGDLSPKEQDRAVTPGTRRRVILSTNVAESSVTIDGVVAVIDSGLARVAGYSPFSGLPTLGLAPVSQASAIQRAGRAGRTRPGRCVRLFTEHDYRGRPAHTTPELFRADLAELVLSLAGLGVTDPAALPWLESPPDAALEAARALLRDLTAIDADGAVTRTGEQLLRWPLHPRLGRLLVAGAELGVVDAATWAAAILSERDVVARSVLGPRGQAHTVGRSDLHDRVDRMRQALRPGGPSARGLGLDAGAVKAVERARRRLTKNAPKNQVEALRGEAEEEALGRAVLYAWPDRVGQRRRAGSPEIRLADGGEVQLAETSIVTDAELLVAVDAIDRGRGPVVHIASAIEADWLLDLAPERIQDGVEIEWNAEAKRVEAFERMRFGRVVLTEQRTSAAGAPGAAERLAVEVRKAGLHTVVDPAALEELVARLNLAAEHAPEAGFAPVDDETIDRAVAAALAGKVKVSRLPANAVLEALLNALPWEQRQTLDRLCPTHISLPRRKRAPITYASDGPPFVSSRIQDFFGLSTTPQIVDGRVKLQVRLLAPNGRPAQITQDLENFWDRHYPEIRKELRRRYPKHDWPERP